MQNYRLEYNEAQGAFHCDNGTHEENSFGWVNLCNEISDSQATEFTKKMREKYPATDLMNEDRDTIGYPPLSIIRSEFEIFLAGIE